MEDYGKFQSKQMMAQGLCAPPTSPNAKTQVSDKMEMVDVLINALYDKIAALEARISISLKPSANYAEGKKERETLVPLAEALNLFAERIQGAIVLLDDLNRRCEL